MKKIIATSIVILFLAVVPEANIFSQQGRGLGPCGMGFGPGNFPYYSMLDLTDEQLSQMRELWLERSEVLNALNLEWQKLRLTYWDLIAEEDENLDAINNNIDRQTELQNKIMKENARFRKKVEGLLTEEQRELLDSEFPYGRGGYGWGNPPGRGIGRGYRDGFGRDYYRGYGRGYYRGYGRGFGGGYGPGRIW